ncbi:hypothetical protein UNSWCS_1545 [Campylobacter concisus UNSWCS]|jgi:hypothetical protein|uniref:Transcription factor zinc-finger domain-containing protein n=1 Tax=Campylobacter concisus UNSWCS TaxID=1242968 RepID=U2F5B6_9BACT|nr:hypothetical protein UNSWCS_1545 [Campylobacter concisus UNSWCS]
MLCPKCACEKTSVLKTIKGLKNIRMRRCEGCGYSWMTEEKPIKDKELIEYAEYIERIEGKMVK